MRENVFYRHSSLEDAATQIRLLQYIRQSDSTSLQFELRSWPLVACPPFFAISYCWGKELPTVDVLVNGMPFTLRANAQYALVQATDQQKPDIAYYWIDTICIDQKNLQEKGQQVRMMASIYGRAQQVYSCVGPGTTHSGFMLSVVEKYFPDLEYHLQQDPDRPAQRLQTYLDETSPVNHDLKGLAAAMKSFIDTPYTSRLWIVQELTSAHPPPLVLWGRGSAPATWWQCMDLWKALVLRELLSADHRTPLLDMGIRIDYRVVTFGEPGPPHMRWSLPSIVTACKDFQCTDPKDSIYGVCSFVRLPPDLPPIKVDYEVTIEELFLRLIPYYLAEHGELAFKALAILSQMIGLQLTSEQYRRLEGFHCLECSKRYLDQPSAPRASIGCRIPQLFENDLPHETSVQQSMDHECICAQNCPHPWRPGLSPLDADTRTHLQQFGCLPNE